ncbi:MAG: nitroreductase family protein [Planctomycetota bacterium]|jgi:nitroreductase
MMDVFEAIKRRYSCRAYEDRPIEQEKLARILEAARLAPSAKNLQDWRFVVVTDADTKAKLAVAARDQKFVATASAVIVACSNNDHLMTCGQAIGPIDVSIALEHIALQATAEGLATCWIGAFYAEKVRAVLQIPEDVEVIELMPVGYPADSQKPPKREPIEKIVCYQKWLFQDSS